ncbi:netrin receptor UNC5D-like [Patiria miniata]|uniref:ZU5 domain-containing protein n=1 Tax=Patiria miniata TaxID=46514 RepID=A0A914AF70_PATMI|nr:netrin receptor UNC5D-like [Patiria miniata]
MVRHVLLRHVMRSKGCGADASVKWARHRFFTTGSSLLEASQLPAMLFEHTSQDTKVQRSQKPNHLQLVLDEVNKLTEKLPESEQLDSRLQLPYIAVGYFDEKGGSLSLDEYGVHLTIPRGALAPGSPQQVYIYVDPTAPPPNDAVELTEVALSQCVKCGPKGLLFAESVVLSFPHHAVLIGQRCDKLVVRKRDEDSQDGQWEDGNPALVTEKMVTVLIDRFLENVLVGKLTPGSGKRLKVGAFGCRLDPGCRQYAFRVHIWNDDKDIEEVRIFYR